MGINYGGVTCDGLASRPGGVEILLAASCYRNRDKLRQLLVSTGSKASLSFLFFFILPFGNKFRQRVFTYLIKYSYTKY